jgi:hypothetical protein
MPVFLPSRNARITLAVRKTPAQRHVVTCGGHLRSNQVSALRMLSIALDFVLSYRCQVADNSLQPGGVMLLGAELHPVSTGHRH